MGDNNSCNNNNCNNNNCNNNSCNNSCNNEQLIKLYNKVFNNIVIKKIILNHLNKFNILSVNIEFTTIKEWQQFKYKDYLNQVSLRFKLDFNQLSQNIKHVKFERTLLEDLHSTPHHIESIGTTAELLKVIQHFGKSNDSNTKLKRLVIYNHLNFDELPANSIPSSITDLKLYFGQSKVQLSKNALPSNLKKLAIGQLKSFEKDVALPDSLTDITIENSVPSFINILPSNSLVNLLYLNLSADIDSSIQLPNSLQKLSIFCDRFNTRLPDNLKSLQLNMGRFEKEIAFPSSLEHLSVDHSYHSSVPIIQNHQHQLNNLISLEFICPSIVDSSGYSILPNSLERLVFKKFAFNQVLQVNQLPSSLTHLDLGREFNQVIDINVLPVNLHTLILGGKYDQAIIPFAIPQQLKLLQILNLDYQHPILLASTHQYTLIRTRINFLPYYQPSSSNHSQIRVLGLPELFTDSLASLQLQDKSNLEYLHLGNYFNHPILPTDLPSQNNIKTLELSHSFSHIITLEYFQNLETIIIQENSHSIIKTTTTIDKQQQVHYNNYKLKNIIVSPRKNQQFIKQLDINFYQFLKYKLNNK